MKKFLLSMLGVLIALPGIARDFTYEYEGQTLTYTVIDEEAKTCKTKEGLDEIPHTPGNDVSGVLVIPSVAKDGDSEYSVTTIGRYAFYACSGLTSVIIPNSVTSIGNEAFEYCFNIVKYAYPSGLDVEIPGRAAIEYPREGAIIEEGFVYGPEKTAIYFAPLSLKGEYVIPESVSSIEWAAFFGCTGLTSVAIPNSVNSIGGYTFSGCSGLTSVTIPNSVNSIGTSAFDGCSNLGIFKIEDGQSLIAFENYAFSSKVNIEYLYIGRNWSYSNSNNPYGSAFPTNITTVEIGNSVTELPNYAFRDCTGLTSVTIANSVNSIGYCAFSDCSGLTSVTIPNSVNSIGGSAFSGCSGLTSVIISNSVSKVGSYAFSRCSNLGIFKIEDGQSLISFENYAFNNANIEYLYIGRNWSYSNDSENSAFPTNITTVEIGNSVTELPNYAFRNCTGLTSVTIPTSVNSIGGSAFSGCSGLTSVIIPNSVNSIGDYAFSRCSGLKKSAYPSSLSYPFNGNGIAIKYPSEGAIIEDGFIYGPEKKAIYFAPISLEGDYVIPESVTEIGENAFYGCSSLNSVKATVVNPPVMNDNSFDGLYATTTLSVPEDAVTDYLATNWSLFENLRIGDSEAAAQTFETGNLKYMLIPGKTQEDKNLAVVIPGDYSSLTEVTIPERFTVPVDGKSVRYYVDGIGFNAFKGCSDLATVTFNSRNASTFIGNYAFAGTKISTITMPQTIESIGDYAFNECKSLSSLDIPGSVKTIGDYAFYKCTSLSSIVIPGSVRTIGVSAFDGIGFRSVTFNEGLESIGDYAFSDFSTFPSQSLYIPSTLKSVGRSAFFTFNGKKVNIADLASWCNIDFANSLSNPLANNNASLYLNGEEIVDLVIPESVDAIKDYTFYGIDGVKSIKFNDALQSIGSYAFTDCQDITNVVIPGNVTAIGEKAFNGSNVSDLTFEYGPKAIDIASDAFPAPSVLSWDRPIGSLNLSTGSLAALTLGNSVPEIPAALFKNVTSLTSLTLGNSLAAIGDEAFSGCTALTEVILPPSVETIGASAFAGNSKLASIIMGHKVNSIGEKAYDLCPAQTVSITAQTPPTAPDNTFSNYTGSLYVQGQEAADAYYDADYCWYQFEAHVMIEPTEMTVEGNKTLTGKAGDTFQLRAALMPENVTLPHIFWRSTNPDIATVDANGLVTLHADMSEVMAMAADDDTSANSCKIIAESLYADGPVAEFTVNNITTGIEDVIYDGGNESGDIDFSVPVEVYNLQGVKVAHSVENLANGIYIVRQGKNVRKIAVK